VIDGLAPLEPGEQPTFELAARYLSDGGVHICREGAVYGALEHGADKAPAVSSSGARAPKPRRKTPEPCVDADDALAELSGGYTCEDAAEQCEEGAFWRVVRAYCPATCGRCIPDPSRFAQPELGERMAVAFGGLGHAPDVKMRRGTQVDANDSPLWLVAERFVISAALPDVLGLESLQRMQAVLGAHGLDGFVYCARFEFAATDLAMPRLVASNCAFAASGILLVVWLFLPLPLAALCVGVVLGVDALVLGMMAMVGMRLNCMSAVALLIALGLSIDYACHIVHAYERSRMPNCRAKVGLLRCHLSAPHSCSRARTVQHLLLPAARACSTTTHAKALLRLRARPLAHYAVCIVACARGSQTSPRSFAQLDEAISSMGLSTLSAGASSLLGTLFLGFSVRARGAKPAPARAAPHLRHARASRRSRISARRERPCFARSLL